jgi:hypothetical protein
MQLIAYLPKIQGFGNGNEVSHLPEFHWLIALGYQSNRNKESPRYQSADIPWV